MRRSQDPVGPRPDRASRSTPRRASARTLAATGGCLLALALLCPTSLRGQSAIQTGAVTARTARVFPFLGARAGVPERLSVSAGLGVDLDPEADPDQPSREVLLALAPGLGAERGSLTYVYSTGRLGSGIAGGVSVVRTVSHPWNAPANATYVGADLALLPIIAIGPRVGLMRRVSRPTDDHPWLWTVDFGFGF